MILAISILPIPQARGFVGKDEGEKIFPEPWEPTATLLYYIAVSQFWHPSDSQCSSRMYHTPTFSVSSSVGFLGHTLGCMSGFSCNKFKDLTEKEKESV